MNEHTLRYHMCMCMCVYIYLYIQYLQVRTKRARVLVLKAVCVKLGRSIDFLPQVRVSRMEAREKKRAKKICYVMYVSTCIYDDYFKDDNDMRTLYLIFYR